MAKPGGAKLNRTETVTVRLDPKLNYLCELASRAQRRTKSSFVEWAVAEALKSVPLPEVTEYDAEIGDSRSVTVQEKSSELWEVDEADRLVALALTSPGLLTHDEQVLWKLIKENGFLWRGRYDRLGEWTWDVRKETIIHDRLRDCWDTFKAVAADQKPRDFLPSWSKTKVSDDVDDEIPF